MNLLIAFLFEKKEYKKRKRRLTVNLTLPGIEPTTGCAQVQNANGIAIRTLTLTAAVGSRKTDCLT